jgi:hypothetical protein
MYFMVIFFWGLQLVRFVFRYACALVDLMFGLFSNCAFDLCIATATLAYNRFLFQHALIAGRVCSALQLRLEQFILDMWFPSTYQNITFMDTYRNRW